MWTLSRIALFPVKSLDPVVVNQAEVLNTGALACDRQFALFDQNNNVINGKKFPEIQKIRSEYDLSQMTVSLSTPHVSKTSSLFHLTENNRDLTDWFSHYLNQPVILKENKSTGYPDDDSASGPTIISTQTYQELTHWFPDISIEELRLRFRVNLEFDGDLPYCEDRLYSATEQPVLFQVGDITFRGTNPCKRCVVPSRSPFSGETDPQFIKTFIQKRADSFPPWGTRALFKNMYRLSVNTRLASPLLDSSSQLQTGNPVSILT